jgi:hypothetical protein
MKAFAQIEQIGIARHERGGRVVPLELGDAERAPGIRLRKRVESVPPALRIEVTVRIG